MRAAVREGRWVLIGKRSRSFAMPRTGDVLLSRFVCLSRNLKGHPFPDGCGCGPVKVLGIVKKTLSRYLKRDFKVWSSSQDVELLFGFDGPDVSGVACIEIPELEMQIDVNARDHICIRSSSKTADLQTLYRRVKVVDEFLGMDLDYLYDREFGYLTADSLRCGCGMHCGAILHCEGVNLAGWMREFDQAVAAVGFVKNGRHIDSVDDVAHTYYIENMSAFGIEEKELLEKAQRVVLSLAEFETKARKWLFKNRPRTVSDSLRRVLAILKSGRLFDRGEMIDLLSIVKMGLFAGFVSGVELDMLNELMDYPDNLELICGSAPSAGVDADALRADAMNRIFSKVRLTAAGEEYLP